jgi:hypothetical protein
MMALTLFNIPGYVISLQYNLSLLPFSPKYLLDSSFYFKFYCPFIRIGRKMNLEIGTHGPPVVGSIANWAISEEEAGMDFISF